MISRLNALGMSNYRLCFFLCGLSLITFDTKVFSIQYKSNTFGMQNYNELHYLSLQDISYPVENFNSKVKVSSVFEASAWYLGGNCNLVKQILRRDLCFIFSFFLFCVVLRCCILSHFHGSLAGFFFLPYLLLEPGHCPLSVVCQQFALNDTFSTTIRLRALIFDLKHCLIDLHHICSSGGPWVQIGPAWGSGRGSWVLK